MRVVLVLDHASINGGLTKVAIDEALGLARRGHRVDLFAAVGPADPRLAAAGVRVTLLDQGDIRAAGSGASLGRFGVQWLWNAAALRALRLLLAKCSGDDTIVHVHGWSQALSPSIGRALAGSGLPVLLSCHDFSLVCPNGVLYDYPAGQACHRRPMGAACLARDCDSHGMHRKALRVGRLAVMRHASGLLGAAPHVVTLSAMQRELLAPHLPAATTFHPLANPVAIDDPGPKPAGAPLGDFLFVGRLSPEKGPMLFAEAARRCGVPATFLGDGKLGPALRERYPQARFLGWQSPAAVRAAMRAARALVFPSTWAEGQPLTVLEALALGTPVIASDGCAAREAVVDGVCGRLFRSGDVVDLAAALAALGDDGAARAMGEAAHRLYWCEPLTPGRHIDRLLDVYEAVRAAHRRRTHGCSRGAPQLWLARRGSSRRAPADQGAQRRQHGIEAIAGDAAKLGEGAALRPG